MFTDIVGYTALTQSDESLALKLLAQHRKLLRPIFAGHGGREVKTIGDAFLIEFDSALDAVECAIEIQRILHVREKQDREAIPVRVGIHVGDVVDREGDLYGDAVNIASRIEPLAGGGDICISEQVYDQVRNKIPFRLSKLESQDLKNVAFPVDVYKVSLPWAKKPGSQTRLNKPTVRFVRRYTVDGVAKRKGMSGFIVKLMMKNKIVDVVILNSPEVSAALARVGGEVDYARGETLHMVSAIETVSVVIDAKNQARLTSMVPKKNILQVMGNLSEIIISFSEAVLTVPGVAAAITNELAVNRVNIIEYVTATRHAIVVVDSKDAMRGYQAVEALASIKEK